MGYFIDDSITNLVYKILWNAKRKKKAQDDVLKGLVLSTERNYSVCCHREVRIKQYPKLDITILFCPNIDGQSIVIAWTALGDGLWGETASLWFCQQFLLQTQYCHSGEPVLLETKLSCLYVNRLRALPLQEANTPVVTSQIPPALLLLPGPFSLQFFSFQNKSSKMT